MPNSFYNLPSTHSKMLPRGQLRIPDCYIYLYHTDEYFILPQFPDGVSDSQSSSFQAQNALSRTAPVFSYANSGPRTVQVNLAMHRDMMNDLNKNNAYIQYNSGSDVIHDPGDDYVDLLSKKLQSVALPRYDASSKLVDPPMVGVRFGEEVFIKGVVTNGVTITYGLPILSNNKYAKVNINFTISEIQPYDADSAGRLGSFRAVTSGQVAKYELLNI